MKEQYQSTYIDSAATTSIVASANQVSIHTVVCPIALTGTATFQDKDGNTYFVLPIGSIGTLRLDAAFKNGLKVVTSAADKLLVNWQQN